MKQNSNALTMRTAYQYCLRPTASQVALMDEWLELLRKQYNYCLAEHCNWWEQNCCDANACPLISHLTELKDKLDFYSQKGDLVNTKELFPEYKGMHLQVLQNCVEGVQKALLAKSPYDPGWGQFLQILSVKAARAGLMTIAVNPNDTSQDCSRCGQKVPKKLEDRWHCCPYCGLELDRDQNAAINIKHRAVGHPVLKAQETPDGIPGVTEKPTLYAIA